MKSQFTPGPWGRHDTNIYVGDTVLVCCPKNHWSNIELPEAEKLANARLIASALEAMTKAYVELVESDYAPCWNAENDKEVISARAIIAKAKGN
jgi:hypothetical protein